MSNKNIKLRLESAIEKVATVTKKLSDSEQAREHFKKGLSHAGRSISDWAKENPKVATALAAGTTGLYLGKKLSKRTFGGGT